MTTGTNTLQFRRKNEVPSNKKVTYGRIVASIRPQKQETHRTRLTVCGNLLDYHGDTSTPTTDLTTTKIHINSVISTPNAKFAITDIGNFYLNNLLPESECMKLLISIILNEIIQQYNLHDIVSDRWVYLEILKGMYGLKQAGKIAHDELVKHLAPYGYKPARHTPGYWKHGNKPIAFVLCVDDFGIKYTKYTNKQDLDHLQQALKEKYNIKEDLTGNLYCGISLKWDYNKRTIKLFIPNYVKCALHKFQHSPLTRKQQVPHPWIPNVFGKQTQFVHEPLPSPPLSKHSTTRIQQIVGTVLYYARAINDIILVEFNSISTMQSKPILDTLRKVNHLLDYLATNLDYEVTYKSSNMILHVDSDAAYLVAPGAKS